MTIVMAPETGMATGIAAPEIVGPEIVGPEIVGIIRFSVLTQSGLASWRATRAVSLDEAAARIFDDRRMEMRLALFRIATLAGFAHDWRGGTRFRLAVLVSPTMPSRWRGELERLIRDLPFVHLVDVPFDSNVGSAARHFVQGLGLGDRTVMSFRIDDDDCLGAGTLAAMAGYAVPAHQGQAVSFVNGLYCGLVDDRLAAVDKTYRSVAVGLSFVSNATDFRSVFSLGAHTRVPENHPFVADERPRAWLRSMHGAADTAGLHGLGDAVTTGDAAAAMLAQNFPFLDTDALRDAYARAAAIL